MQQTRRWDCLFIKIPARSRNVCSQVLHLFVCLQLCLSPTEPSILSFSFPGWQSFCLALMELVYGFCSRLCWLPQEQALYHFFMPCWRLRIPSPPLRTHLIMCIYSEINFYFTVAGKHGKKREELAKRGKSFYAACGFALTISKTKTKVWNAHGKVTTPPKRKKNRAREGNCHKCPFVTSAMGACRKRLIKILFCPGTALSVLSH